jgi:hypothetical protein
MHCWIIVRYEKHRGIIVGSRSAVDFSWGTPPFYICLSSEYMWSFRIGRSFFGEEHNKNCFRLQSNRAKNSSTTGYTRYCYVQLQVNYAGSPLCMAQIDTLTCQKLPAWPPVSAIRTHDITPRSSCFLVIKGWHILLVTQLLSSTQHARCSHNLQLQLIVLSNLQFSTMLTFATNYSFNICQCDCWLLTNTWLHPSQDLLAILVWSLVRASPDPIWDECCTIF